ncbi:MAG: sigma 54-interacting transcriptional regulator [Spirochaetaceae bacterium]|nr:sigma 54-interacting transcriptional regulator [Spirochaetaceae bacterium]
MLTSNIDGKRLATLIEINNLINLDYQDAHSLLSRILESATRLSFGEASSLLLVNNENNKLYFEISIGTKKQELKKYSLKMGEGIAGWVAKNSTSLIVNDVDTDPRYFAEIGDKIGFNTKSILAVPMLIKDKCVGVIEIINRSDGGYFTNEDLQWLEMFASQSAIAIKNAKEYERVKNEVNLLQEQVVSHNETYHILIGSSKIIKDKLAIAKKIAATESSVLITGESGVGKELFAEQIHLNSNRSNLPFIRVNCASLPENLIENELFGHVKGAFTDAVKETRGRFELADGGTIFLDEIGEIPLNLQSKLLRVLQHKIFEKLGSSIPIHVDVRIIAATNINMEDALKKGSFRKDLYYRLNVLPFFIPPLRDHKEDIPELTKYFLNRIKSKTNKQLLKFSDGAMGSLLTYNWPGNIRELENIIERAAIISTNEEIKPEALMLGGKNSNDLQYYEKPLKEAILQFKNFYIKNSLDKNNWNQTITAKVLGIQRTYLSKLIKENNLKP